MMIIFKKTIYAVIAIAVCGLMLAVGTPASEIIVSWETNGILVATGMEPGTTGPVEAVSSLGQTFTNAAAFFTDGYVVDSNGTIRLEVPIFFRVKGTPVPPPEGMVVIPSGINSGTNPLADGESYSIDYPATYSLTNEAAFYMDATEVTKGQWDAAYNWATPAGGSFLYGGGQILHQHVASWPGLLQIFSCEPGAAYYTVRPIQTGECI